MDLVSWTFRFLALLNSQYPRAAFSKASSLSLYVAYKNQLILLTTCISALSQRGGLLWIFRTRLKSSMRVSEPSGFIVCR
jgi:hypothetical protein